MGTIVNFNRHRKRAAREDEARQAAENRVRSGLSKAQRLKERLEKNRKEKSLDSKKIED